MSGIEEHEIVRYAWVEALVEVVRKAMTPYGFIGHLGYLLWQPESPQNSFDGWLLCVYPTAYELKGGQHDGHACLGGFHLNIGSIINVFSKTKNVGWDSHVQYNGDLDGPCIEIEGCVLGEQVLLKIFNAPPPDEPVSHTVDGTGVVCEFRPQS